jgi:spore maturation protein CgeB
MKFVVFCHSLISDWNHGNAHFLRGVVAELQGRGHAVDVYEPRDGWSRHQLLADAGPGAIASFHAAFPELRSRTVDYPTLDLDAALAGADVVLVHEWSPASLVARIGRHRRRNRGYRLFFHDTHHRSASDFGAIQAFELEDYDGVLAFGEAVRERYVELGWGHRVWTWHEAADVRVFHPLPGTTPDGDLVWIGNWGDGERSAEIRSYLVEPVLELGLRARIHGVRYPEAARHELAAAGIEYAGWLPNYLAPLAYAAHRVTVHIPRRPYVEALPGIPTIRVFEALACGIPLVSAWWEDREGLFTAGHDFLVADTPAEMCQHLRALLNDGERARELAAHGLATIRQRHTCAHRVDQLMGIVEGLRGERKVAVINA